MNLVEAFGIHQIIEPTKLDERLEIIGRALIWLRFGDVLYLLKNYDPSSDAGKYRIMNIDAYGKPMEKIAPPYACKLTLDGELTDDLRGAKFLFSEDSTMTRSD